MIPAKPLAMAKSRLAAAAGSLRPELALAMLLDTVEATLAADGVVAVFVVTDDDTVAASATELGAAAVADEPRDGLNAAFRHGIATATVQYPGAGVVLLTGDLPALRTLEFEAALLVTGSSTGAVAVADREGVGTTMLASRWPAELRPAFGAGSFERHRALGAHPLEHNGLDGLRCDVDDAEGLSAALLLGFGRRTAALAR